MAPISENLFAEDQPAIMIPITLPQGSATVALTTLVAPPGAIACVSSVSGLTAGPVITAP